MPLAPQRQSYEAGTYTLLVDTWTRPDGTTFYKGDPVVLDRAEATRLGNADSPTIAPYESFQAKVARGEIMGNRVDLDASPEQLRAEILALQTRLEEKTQVFEANDKPLAVPADPEKLGSHGNALDSGGGAGLGHQDRVAPDDEDAADEDTRNVLAGNTTEAEQALEADKEAQAERASKAAELKEKRAEQRRKEAEEAADSEPAAKQSSAGRRRRQGNPPESNDDNS